VTGRCCVAEEAGDENLQAGRRGRTAGGADQSARTVERTLARTPGVTRAAVDLQAASAIVEYDPGVVKPEALAEAVRDLGYEVPA